MAYAGGAAGAGSCAGGFAITSTGTILVLFILLVIISRTVFFGY
ncbi:sporulation protein YjcZ [Paenibacillus turpanensis]|nr:sporulation protein YjcZ [Paenibacillus turpanensis]